MDLTGVLRELEFCRQSLRSLLVRLRAHAIVRKDRLCIESHIRLLTKYSQRRRRCDEKESSHIESMGILLRELPRSFPHNRRLVHRSILAAVLVEIAKLTRPGSIPNANAIYYEHFYRHFSSTGSTPSTLTPQS